MLNVVAIIVTYNRLKYLQKALSATLAQPFSAVIVVDNASTDGSREWLAAQTDSRLQKVFLPTNQGGAGGFQAGMAQALTLENADWLLLFDDDAYPAPDTVEQFIKQDLTNIDAAAAAVYYPNGDICEMNRPSYVPFWSRKRFWRTLTGLFTARSREGFHLKPENYQQSTPIKVDCSSFVGFFVRTQWARNHPLPDGKLFIYGDDILYTLQLSKAGGRLYFLPVVRFYHDCSTLKTQQGAYFPLWKAYFTYRNGLILYRHAAGWWFYPVAAVKIVTWFLALRFYQQKKLFLRLWALAVWDGWRQNTARNPREIIQLFTR